MYSIIIGGILLFQQRLSSKTFFFLAVMQELSCIDSFQEYTSLDMLFKTGRYMFSVFFSELIQLSVSSEPSQVISSTHMQHDQAIGETGRHQVFIDATVL